VSRLDLLPGQKIRKGQWLMSLENPAFLELQQSYLEAKEQLTYLKADFDRQQILAQENIASQKQSLKAESEYRVTLARFKSYAAQLKLLNINLTRVDSGDMVSSISLYSPISGFVNKVHAVRGQFVAASEVAVELISTDHIHVELEVFEKDILKVKKGQHIFFQVPDMGGVQHEAEVFLVGHEVAEDRRVVNIHGHLLEEEETHAQFVPGMFVEGRIALEEKNQLSLPEEAIIPVEGKTYVLVQQVSEAGEYHFLPQEVQLGLQQQGWIEILNASEFAPASQIVLRGGFQLLQGEVGGHDH
jgi:cobalt-zinc-cadmium efflux system membrane fusion protein